MATAEQNIQAFAKQVHRLIEGYKTVSQENAELYAMVDERDKKIAELQLELKQSQQRYDSLLAARMLNIADADVEVTKKKLNKLIRTVNQCITMLSEEKDAEQQA